MFQLSSSQKLLGAKENKFKFYTKLFFFLTGRGIDSALHGSNQSREINKCAITIKMTNIGQVLKRMPIDDLFKQTTFLWASKEAVDEFRIHGESECATSDDVFRRNVVARADAKTALQHPTNIDLELIVRQRDIELGEHVRIRGVNANHCFFVPVDLEWSG